MQDAVRGLRTITLPRTRVNKGKQKGTKKGRGPVGPRPPTLCGSPANEPLVLRPWLPLGQPTPYGNGRP
jgi:hypothetical protein